MQKTLLVLEMFTKIDVLNILKSLREQLQRESVEQECAPLDEGDYSLLWDIAEQFGLTRDQAIEVVGEEGKRLII